MVLLLAVAWLFAGPAQLGGKTTYVATHGISMEPRFHTGDLALVRPAADYRVGDVVAYRSAALHRVVLHRIIGRDGPRYVFQGDNNDFVDPIHPERDELIGKLWVRVPRGGAILSLLHTPIVAALLCGAVAMLVVWPARRRRRRRGDRHRGAPAVSRSATPNAQMLLTGCAALAAACLVLGVVAWMRSASHPVAAKVAYTQKVRFSYRADAPAGAVYPDGTVRTGDPIFVRLVRQVRVKVAYRFASAAPSELTGTQEIALRLSSPSGWSRTIPLQGSTPFRGTAGSAWIVLDLDRLQALIHRVETLTGAPAGAAFTVDVLPRVHVKGTLAGQTLDDRFAPALTFQLDPLQLRTGAGSGSTAASAAARSGALPVAFTPSEAGSVAAIAHTPSRLSVGRLGLRVSTARWVALLGLLLAGVVALLTTARERRRPTDLSAQIHARYKHLIVPVSSIVLSPDQPIVDVMTIEALAQVAERCERVILHHHRIGAETYLVDDEGTLYRYQPRPYFRPEAVAA
ncbi:MAG TPA: signal peptidase I [Baekduia sp.]|nr:signal peptidase I [Baekduia sp.]